MYYFLRFYYYIAVEMNGKTYILDTVNLQNIILF
jgi:hypothetical protein